MSTTRGFVIGAEEVEAQDGSTPRQGSFHGKSSGNRRRLRAC